MTALVGQAYLAISDSEKYNIDVLWSVFGFEKGVVDARAAQVTLGDASFRVMHPLHVLYSRLVNLHKLRDKQDAKGVLQLQIAVEVGRQYLREQAMLHPDKPGEIERSYIQPLVSKIEKFAIDDAGRKVAFRHGIHVADAIDPSLIPAGNFWLKKWPELKALMSNDYAARFQAPPAPAPGAKGDAHRQARRGLSATRSR